MDIKIGSVSWVDGLTFDDERNSALKAHVGSFRYCKMKPDGDRYTVSNFFGRKRGWVRYDDESGEESRKEQRCVVVGRTEGSVDKDHYYILVVVPTREDGEYRRVGVGMVRTGYVERLRADVRIV